MQFVWMLLRQGDEFQWLPETVHASRQSALAALPVGSVHHPGDPDAEMSEPEEWETPRDGYWHGSRLRIQEWPVVP